MAVKAAGADNLAVAASLQALSGLQFLPVGVFCRMGNLVRSIFCTEWNWGLCFLKGL